MMEVTFSSHQSHWSMYGYYRMTAKTHIYSSAAAVAGANMEQGDRGIVSSQFPNVQSKVRTGGVTPLHLVKSSVYSIVATRTGGVTHRTEEVAVAERSHATPPGHVPTLIKR